MSLKVISTFSNEFNLNIFIYLLRDVINAVFLLPME